MKYVVEMNPQKEQVIEVPEGTRVEHSALNLCQDGKPTVVPRLQFFLGEDLLASFVGVLNFYRWDLTPRKNDWVTGTR